MEQRDIYTVSIAAALDGEGVRGIVIRWSLLTLIVLNISAGIVGSVPEIAVTYSPALHVFYVASLMVFTLEYVVRLWVQAPKGQRLRFAATPLMLIDLMVLLPFYFGFSAPVDLRIFRLLQVLKLFRHFAVLSLLGRVLRAEARPMLVAVFVMLGMIVIAASLMHHAEGAVQPDAFGDVPRAMWWATVTLTTVGYGDVSPVTPMGQVIAAAVMILGVGMVALPAGMLASRFSQELHREDFGLIQTSCPKCHAGITLEHQDTWTHVEGTR